MREVRALSWDASVASSLPPNYSLTDLDCDLRSPAMSMRSCQFAQESSIGTESSSRHPAAGWAAAATKILSAKIVLRFGVPRFRPVRFVPGFHPLGICNSHSSVAGCGAAVARCCLCSCPRISPGEVPLERGLGQGDQPGGLFNRQSPLRRPTTNGARPGTDHFRALPLFEPRQRSAA